MTEERLYLRLDLICRTPLQYSSIQKAQIEKCLGIDKKEKISNENQDTALRMELKSTKEEKIGNINEDDLPTMKIRKSCLFLEMICGAVTAVIILLLADVQFFSPSVLLILFEAEAHLMMEHLILLIHISLYYVVTMTFCIAKEFILETCFAIEYLIMMVQISLQNVLNPALNGILGDYLPFVLVFALVGNVNNSKRERKSPEEIVKTIFYNASATPKSVNKIAQDGELQWNTAEKYIRLIELIQSLPLQIIRTEEGNTYISRIPAEELTFDQKIQIYKISYSPKLTEEQKILISLLSRPEGEEFVETPEIEHLAKIGRIRKEGDRCFLTRDGEIIAEGLRKMFSEEIREIRKE